MKPGDQRAESLCGQYQAAHDSNMRVAVEPHHRLVLVPLVAGGVKQLLVHFIVLSV